MDISCTECKHLKRHCDKRCHDCEHYYPNGCVCSVCKRNGTSAIHDGFESKEKNKMENEPISAKEKDEYITISIYEYVSLIQAQTALKLVSKLLQYPTATNQEIKHILGVKDE